MYSLDKIKKNKFKVQFSCTNRYGTGRYKSVRTGTKSGMEQKCTNFVKLPERSVLADTETELITLVRIGNAEAKKEVFNLYYIQNCMADSDLLHLDRKG